jgi:hypothetical protein
MVISYEKGISRHSHEIKPNLLMIDDGESPPLLPNTLILALCKLKQFPFQPVTSPLPKFQTKPEKVTEIKLFLNISLISQKLVNSPLFITLK